MNRIMLLLTASGRLSPATLVKAAIGNAIVANVAAVVLALMVSNDASPAPLIAVTGVAAVFVLLAYGAVAVYRRQQ